MKKVLLSAVLVLVASSAFALNISGSKHDLSAGNTSNASRGTSDQLCKYCHVPHNAAIPAALWSRNADSGAVTTKYDNAGSLNATTAIPTATQSTACLGCHNVTPSTGVDATVNLTSGIATASRIINEAVTGLTNDHPIAFAYNAALVTADTATAGGVVGLQTPSSAILVNNGTGNGLPLYTESLECASCHAVHGAGHPSFLRTTVAGSVICLKCHIK